MIKLLLISLLCVAVFLSGQAKAEANGEYGEYGGYGGYGAGGYAGMGFNFGVEGGVQGDAGGRGKRSVSQLVTHAQIRGQQMPLAAQNALRSASPPQGRGPPEGHPRGPPESSSLYGQGQ
nr:PREDICTED: neuropeptide-like protein 29 [Linepithema humile]